MDTKGTFVKPDGALGSLNWYHRNIPLTNQVSVTPGYYQDEKCHLNNENGDERLSEGKGGTSNSGTHLGQSSDNKVSSLIYS